MEERVFLNAELGALAGHDVDGVVQEGVSEGGGARGKVDWGRRMVALGEREGADVVEVGVSDQDGICRVEGELLIARNGVRTFFLGMHARVENDGFPIEIQSVGVGSDF